MVWGIKDTIQSSNNELTPAQKNFIKERALATNTMTVARFVAETIREYPQAANFLNGSTATPILKKIQQAGLKAKALLEAGEKLPEPLKDFEGKWSKIEELKEVE